MLTICEDPVDVILSESPTGACACVERPGGHNLIVQLQEAQRIVSFRLGHGNRAHSSHDTLMGVIGMYSLRDMQEGRIGALGLCWSDGSGSIG